MTQAFLIVFLLVQAANAVYLAAGYAVARLVGAQVLEVGFGFGKTLFKLGIVSVKMVPGGGFVRMYDSSEGNSPPVPRTGTAYNELPRLSRVAAVLAGSTALVAFAVALRGSAGWHSVRSGFTQILHGTFAPATEGAGLVTQLATTQQTRGTLTLFAIICAKFAAYNLLPLPPISGGQALVILLRPRGHFGDLLESKLQVVGVWLICALMVSWLAAIYFAVRA
jgi:hypothetical protein